MNQESTIEDCQNCGSYICKCEVKPFEKQDSTESWEEKARKVREILSKYRNEWSTYEVDDFLNLLKEELELERQKVKEETLAMVLKEIEKLEVYHPEQMEDYNLIDKDNLLEALDTLKEKLQTKQ